MKPLILLLSLLLLTLTVACSSEEAIPAPAAPTIPAATQNPESLPASAAPTAAAQATPATTPTPMPTPVPSENPAAANTPAPTASPASIPTPSPTPAAESPKSTEVPSTPAPSAKSTEPSMPTLQPNNEDVCQKAQTDNNSLIECYELITSEWESKPLSISITEEDFAGLKTLVQSPEPIPHPTENPSHSYFNADYEGVPWQQGMGIRLPQSQTEPGQAEHFLESPWWQATNIRGLFDDSVGYEIREIRDSIPERSTPHQLLGQEIAEAISEWMEDQLTNHEWANPQLRRFVEGNIEPRNPPEEFSPEIHEGQLQKYLQTTAWLPIAETRVFYEDRIKSQREFQYDFQTPLVSWKPIEESRDSLPIVQFTAWNKTNLPYYIVGKCDPNDVHTQGQCGVTKYAVTFVVAFQDCGEGQSIQPYGLLSDIFIQIFENKENSFTGEEEKGILAPTGQPVRIEANISPQPCEP